MSTRPGVPRRAASLAELTEGMERLGPVPGTDGKSGSPLERLRRDDEAFVLKGQSRRHDWTLRVMGDRTYAGHRVYASSLLADLPDEIDHAIEAFAFEADPEGGPDADDACLWILMRDLGRWLVPEGDQPVAPDVNRTFLDHMAGLHAAFWGGSDDLGLITMDDRILSFSPAVLNRELALDPDLAVPRLAREGWQRLATRDPELAALLGELHADVTPLVASLASTPTTFLHGDWKMGNLGRHDDGRTILIDWSYPGFGPGSVDLAWYLALNRARLSVPKDEAIETYRRALEDRGVDTGGWFDRQLALGLLAMATMFGWEKAYDDDDELAWWSTRAHDARELLG